MTFAGGPESGRRFIQGLKSGRYFIQSSGESQRSLRFGIIPSPVLKAAYVTPTEDFVIWWQKKSTVARQPVAARAGPSKTSRRQGCKKFITEIKAVTATYTRTMKTTHAADI